MTVKSLLALMDLIGVATVALATANCVLSPVDRLTIAHIGTAHGEPEVRPGMPANADGFARNDWPGVCPANRRVEWAL